MSWKNNKTSTPKVNMVDFEDKNIVVISPHLDDAILSLGSHLLSLAKKDSITVLTIFTSFSSAVIPGYSKEVIAAAGFTSSEEYGKQRQLEDSQAFQALDINYHHLGFVDGGFRSKKGKALYPTPDTLFSPKYSPQDKGLIESISEKLDPFLQNCEVVMYPLGIGNHVDHVLSRIAIEHIRTKHYKAEYWQYFDVPYSLRVKDIAPLLPTLIAKCFLQQSSIKLSLEKNQFVSNYSSQIPLLFKNFNAKKTLLPEILLKR